MRSFVSLLALMLLATPAGRAAPPDKPEAETPAATAQQASWKIRRLSFSKKGAEVTLEDTTSHRRIALVSATSGAARLLSAEFAAESGELHVEAVIDGARLTIVQKISELDGDERIASGKPGSAGPTPEDRHRYEKLSTQGREKFRNQLREKFADEAFRNLPEKERRAAIRAIFDKVEQEEKEAPASSSNDKEDTYPVKEELELTRALTEGKFEGQRKVFEKLSEEAREKFRKQLREKFSDAQFRNAPEDERRAAIRALFEKIEKEDQMPR